MVFLSISIKNKIRFFFSVLEILVAKEEQNVEGTFNEGSLISEISIILFIYIDFEKMIPSLVEQNRAAYYFIRLDTVNEISGHNWLLISYIPDAAKVIDCIEYGKFHF
jgi:hypothetical protein